MIGKLIKQYLKDNGLSQRFIAKKIGMTPKTLNAMLNDKRGISVEEYFKICGALGVDANTFCNGRISHDIAGD